MSKYEEGKVYFLEMKDVDGMKLKSYATQNHPVVVMVKSENCGHCIDATPAFEKLAENQKDVSVRCIRQEDPSGKELLMCVRKWYKDFRGFPTYLGFDKNGNFKSVHSGDRTEDALLEFVTGL